MVRQVLNLVKLVFAAVIIFSCNSNTSKGVSQEITIIKRDTTLLNSKKVQHYNDGKLKNIIYTDENGKQKKSISYFKNGNKKSEINITNGKKNGLEKLYFDSGELKSEFNWDNGKEFGDAFWYYKNGNIKKYEYSSLNKKLIFRRTYSVSGGIESDEGDYFDLVFKERKNELEEINFYFPSPPKPEISIFINGKEEECKDGFLRLKIKPTDEVQYLNLLLEVSTEVSFGDVKNESIRQVIEF